jgi:hypothetical protein
MAIAKIILGVTMLLAGVAWAIDVFSPDDMTRGARQMAAGFLALWCVAIGVACLFA